jgi:glucose-6-phosphate dehydrogenase assembly protein OpcA
VSLDVHPIVDELTAARHSESAMKAATMTLVVFFENPSVASWVTHRAHLIAEKHPSRVLMFDGTKNEGEQHAEPSVARGEWVEVGVRGSRSDELAEALSMLALPEAPVVLAWVATGIQHDDRFVALAQVADTVVVSSSAIAADDSALRDLTAFVAIHPQIVVQDISYLRLGAWQELIAEFFDEPQFLSELTELRDVEISAGSDAEMYYLLGWLASRLGWMPCTPNELCNSNGNTIRFSLAREGTPRRLARVILKSKAVTFSAQVLESDPDAVCLEVTGAKHRDRRCAPLHTMDIASLIERALLRKSQDEIFMQSLTMAKLIMERKIA